MLNCGYSINHDFANNSEGRQFYTISLDGTEIYRARIDFKNETDSESVDIAPILREYMGVLYEQLDFSAGVKELPSDGLISSTNTFTLAPDGGASATYDVVYNYNTKYELESDSSTVMNYPIGLQADPRQLMFMGGLPGAVLSYSTSKGQSGSATLSGNGLSVYIIDLSTLNLDTEDTITLISNGDEQTYTIKPYCRNRFALYYANEYGILDSLLCFPNTVEAYNADVIEVRFQNDYNSRLDLHRQRIEARIEKRYNVVTGYLDNEGIRNITHLIFSPKVYIHDLDADTITACIVNNTNIVTGYDRFNNYRWNYQFVVEESQLYLRK